MQRWYSREEEEANRAAYEADRPAREANEQAKDALKIAASLLQPAVDKACAAFNKASFAGKQMWEVERFLAGADKLSARDGKGRMLEDQVEALLYPSHSAPRNTEAVIALTVRILAAAAAYKRVSEAASKAKK